MPLLTINNSQGEENLEISVLHEIVSICTYNVFDGVRTDSGCELSKDQVKQVIETLQKLI